MAGVVLLTSSNAVALHEFAKLAPSEGANLEGFGWPVDIDGNTAIVGSTRNDEIGGSLGSAYLLDITSGAQIAKLNPSDGTPSDFFGTSVGISGNTAIVGAYGGEGNIRGSGAAYLFDATTGTQLAKLASSDGTLFDWFGISVDISGNTAIVGAQWDDDNGRDSGSAYLFDVSTGAQLAKLRPDDGATLDEFGVSVGIDGNTAIVGAWWDDDNGRDSGSAYLFDVATGVQIAKLTPNDGAAGEAFGRSVGISGKTAIIGAYRDDDNGPGSGSAYLFDITTGAQLGKLTPSDGATNDNFGNSVAISGETAIIGAWGTNDYGIISGSAYLFDITTGAQLAKLSASDGAARSRFGVSVSISDNMALVGSHTHASYLFDATIPEPSTLLLAAWTSVGSLAHRRRRIKV